MFWRVVHLAAVASIVGSAVYAYTIKYETIWQGEQLAKIRRDIARERDEIAAMKAEWAKLSRPERLQALAARTDLQALTLDQIGRVSDLPERTSKFDAIGRKLELLGLSEPTATPVAPGVAVDTTPTSSLPASPPTPPVVPRR